MFKLTKIMNVKNLTAAESLIAKHHAWLNLTFFSHPNSVHSALDHEEIGWTAMSGPIRHDDLFLQPIKVIQEVYTAATVDAIAYHRRVCGIKSYSGKRLGCNGACTITAESYAATGNNVLTDDEARILSALFDEYEKDSEDISLASLDLPYTAENILAFAGL